MTATLCESHFALMKGTASWPRYAAAAGRSLPRFAQYGGAQYAVSVAETTAARFGDRRGLSDF